MNRIIEMSQVKKNYYVGDVVVKALQGVDLTIDEGEFVAIMGSSGSGKSTLMNIIGCLDNINEGEYVLDSVNVKNLSRNEYADIRNQKIGFVFQGFNLLPRTTALENVELPLLYDRNNRIKHPEIKAKESLDKVGLSDRIDHEPNQLSGGQQQRVAIARALVTEPALLLADEPTGNLDSRTSKEVMALFQELNTQGITIILVTHERDIAKYAKRNIVLRDGKIIEDFIVEDRLIATEVLQSVTDGAIHEMV